MKLHGPLFDILVPRVAAGYMRLVNTTQRLHVTGQDGLGILTGEERSCVAMVWHNRILLGAVAGVGRHLSVMVSRSRDGAYMANTIERLGYSTVRGSTSQGQLQSVRELVGLLKEGRQIVMTPDGPRGPCYHLQRGPIEVARLSGAPIVPVGFTPSRVKRIGSWDRLIVPLPFTEVAAVVGDPITIPADATKQEREALRAQVERTLCEVTRQSETLVGCTEDPDLQR